MFVQEWSISAPIKAAAILQPPRNNDGIFDRRSCDTLRTAKSENTGPVKKAAFYGWTLRPAVRRSAQRCRPALQHLFNPADRFIFCLQATGETVGFDAGQQRLEKRSGLQPE